MEAPPVDGFGDWYDAKQGDTGDLWHRTLIDPALLARVGEPPAGCAMLDLGCGNGYLARRFARRGARVTGVDAAGALIAAARRREEAEPLGIVYHEADAAHLPMLDDGSVDLVIANMSLMDIPDAAGALREVGRVLRPGGRFVFSISHPCFDVDTRSAWEILREGERETVFRKVTGYRQLHSDVYAWELEGGRRVTTVGFHRPLGWYAHRLREAGLVIVDLEEPAPQAGFVSRARARREWIEEIPLHLILEARREGPPVGGGVVGPAAPPPPVAGPGRSP